MVPPSFPRAKDAPFPFESPYPCQEQLINTLLESLENHTKDSRCPVYMLESPTGTGKSMSLASAALAWIRHMDVVDLSETTTSTTPPTNADESDWLSDWKPQEEREEQEKVKMLKTSRRNARTELESKLHQIRNSWATQNDRRRSMIGATLAAKRDHSKPSSKRTKQEEKEEMNFCLHEYQSDTETVEFKDDKDPETKTRSPSDDVTCGRQFIYAARTHSQLSQFVHEIKRVDAKVRVVHLGGRSALCGNSKVRHLATEHAITEACLDLQQAKREKKRKENNAGCPLLASRDTTIPVFALHIQAAPMDIEEVAALGQQTQTCAYYGSRAAIRQAQVICLPYNMLLSKNTREAVGLSLEGSLVAVDEAHNLPEAIRGLHASRVTSSIVQAALDQMGAYTKKYADRLAGRNIFYLGQLRKLLVGFKKRLRTTIERTLFSVTEFLIQCKLENINLFRVMRYLARSRLSQKLLGFINATDPETSTEGELSRHVSALSGVETFLEKLTLDESGGKIVMEPPTDGKPAVMRYVLLQPSIYLDSVLQEAHAVALVGGTLRPFVHMAAELLGDDILIHEAANADQALESSTVFRTPNLTAFSCGHVVPASHVLLQCWRMGPTNQKLDFRYRPRATHAVCNELGRCLQRLARTVPNGMVVFFPSYAYEYHVVQHWKKTGLWELLDSIKPIHREPKSARDLDDSLRSFSDGATSLKGALLLSIIGGKMSEGINFADEKARCVVVVGLPYPNIEDPELKEKMAALDRSKTIPGRQYVHNLCMRAVNQSIGRAIRHAKDYAGIILLDERYVTDHRVREGLPSWLCRGENWRHDLTIDQHLAELSSFFTRKVTPMKSV